VTKAFVEQVRGVDCSGVLGSLTAKELVEEKGRLELPGRPLLYGTTENFLRCFNISNLEQLPALPENDEESKDESLDSNDSENQYATDLINDNTNSADN
jgi:segregation and condensation protein B